VIFYSKIYYSIIALYLQKPGELLHRVHNQAAEVTKKTPGAYYIARGCYHVQKQRILPQVVVHKEAEHQENPSAAPLVHGCSCNVPCRNINAF
jgi:hypothetical protein